MKAKFRVGDHVSFNFPSNMRVEGTIIEDQGPIGRHGRRMYHVEVPMDPQESEVHVMPEEDLDASNGTSVKSAPIALAKIIEYLKVGGLLSLLRNNNLRPAKHVRVWILRDWLGNLTHSLVEERGLVGGQLVPAHAIYDNRVHSAKRAEVVEFLRGFGLSKSQAADVISEVGTAP